MTFLKPMTLVDCWAEALTQDVELRGRQVWSRDPEAADAEPFAFVGVLESYITEEAFWAEVAEAYSK